jgi:hypothetical protein
MENGVAAETRPRGHGAARRRRGLTWFLALAALLHVPLTPIGALIGLLALIRPPAEEPPPETLNAIPVSLLSDEELAALGVTNDPPPAEPAVAPAPAPGEAAVVPEVPKPKPKPKPKPVEAPDGGIPEAADGGRPEPPKKPKPLAEAGDGGAPKGEPKKPAGGDPLALAGKAASVADPNANIRLLILNDHIRPLPIAPRLGKLIARLPQWASFFGPTSLDPIRDIDRMYLAGPQFRASGDVVAVIEYAVSQATMRQAIDAIVARPPPGEWLDEKMPVARARADRAERLFLLPKGKTLLMVPPHLKDDAVSKAASLRVPPVKGNAVLVAFIATPWRILLGVRAPADIPHSIASVSLTVEPREDGGAVIHISAVDGSPEAARSNAATLTSAINLLTQRDVGELGSLLFGGKTLSLVEPVELHADGKKIVGDAVVTRRQLDRIIGFAEGWLDSMQSRRAPQTVPAPGGAPAAPAAVPTTRPASSGALP